MAFRSSCTGSLADRLRAWSGCRTHQKAPISRPSGRAVHGGEQSQNAATSPLCPASRATAPRSRLSSTAGVQTGSGPSSNVNAHRRAPIVIIHAEGRHPTPGQPTQARNERSAAALVPDDQVSNEWVGRSVERHRAQAREHLGFVVLMLRGDLFDHGRIRPYLGCLGDVRRG